LKAGLSLPVDKTSVASCLFDTSFEEDVNTLGRAEGKAKDDGIAYPQPPLLIDVREGMYTKVTPFHLSTFSKIINNYFFFYLFSSKDPRKFQFTK
jgi:hypothetical protein